MLYRTLFLLSFLLLAEAGLFAQCEQFKPIMQKAEALWAQGAFEKAFAKLAVAREVCPAKAAEVDAKYSAFIRDISEKYRLVERQKFDLAVQTAKTDSALQKANKLIEAYYFYADRFALALKQQYGQNKFYFIDKNGDPVRKLSEHDRAEQFDEFGYSKVNDRDFDYLLDTFGNSYRAAFSITNLGIEITALDLRGKQLDSFTSEILRHSQLKVLILNNGYFKKGHLSLPPTIKGLGNLQGLHIAQCHLDSLPAEIGGLKNLRSLDLNSNYLTSLPAEIMELKDLTKLNLAGNQLNKLPAGIGKLQKLEELDLSGYIGFDPETYEEFAWRNQLTQLPSEIGELKSLKILDLGWNQLTSLPAEIGELKNLHMLNLSSNKLTALPAEIRELKNLQSLELEDNELTALPAEIRELKNLQSLELGDNELTVLPTEIAELKSLQTLKLGDNQLTSLPAEIRQMKALTELHLGGNPFPPDYISQLRKDMPWCEIKF